MKIQVVWYDDEGKADTGLNAVTRALTVDRVNVAVGFLSSDVYFRVIDEFQKASTPVIACCSASLAIGDKIARHTRAPAAMTRRVLLTLACVIAAAIPLLWSHPFVLHIATQALIWALLAASWDLLGGYTGQISFGHAGFFSIGAYAAAIATQRFGVPSYAAMRWRPWFRLRWAWRSAFRRCGCGATISRW